MPITDAIRQAAEHGDHVTSEQFKTGSAELRADIIAALAAQEPCHRLRDCHCRHRHRDPCAGSADFPPADAETYMLVGSEAEPR